MLRKRTKILWLTAVLCVLCVAAAVIMVMQGPRQEIHFTPPQFDPSAVKGIPELDNADGYGTIDASVYRFSACGAISLKENKVDIWLTNYAENDVWLKMVLKDENDNVLGETGIIRPGEYVQSIALAVVPENSCAVRMIVMGYEPETYLSIGNVTLQTVLQIEQQ